MKATHSLERQGQVSSGGSKSSSTQKPLTYWTGKDRHCQQGFKSSSPWKPLTYWGAKDRHCQQGQTPAHHGSPSPTGEARTGIISRVQIQLTTEATHKLERRGQALSAGSKSSSPQKPHTHWTTEDRHCQRSPNPVWHHIHSLSRQELGAGFK